MYLEFNDFSYSDYCKTWKYDLNLINAINLKLKILLDNPKYFPSTN